MFTRALSRLALLAVVWFWICSGSAAVAGLLAVTEETPPLCFRGEGGRLEGYAADLAREIFHRLGQSENMQLLPWARAYQEALHEPDVVVFPTTRTPEREKLFRWVGPLVRIRWCFFKRADDPLTLSSLDDARSVTSIGTYTDDARDVFLRTNGFVNLDRSSCNLLNLRKLLAGRVRLMAWSDLGVGVGLRRMDLRDADVATAYCFQTVDLYFALSRGTDQAEADRWDETLRAIRDDGTMARLARLWDIPAQDVPPAAKRKRPRPDAGKTPADAAVGVTGSVP